MRGIQEDEPNKVTKPLRSFGLSIPELNQLKYVKHIVNYCFFDEMEICKKRL